MHIANSPLVQYTSTADTDINHPYVVSYRNVAVFKSRWPLVPFILSLVLSNLRGKNAKYILSAIVIICASELDAQNLQPADSLFLQKLRTELQLPDSTQQNIDSIYKVPIQRLQQIDKEMNRIARMDIPQSDKDKRFSELRAEKKSLKEDRELTILRLLNPEQQAIYTTKVVPTKPAVLHMGSNHDRASCTVCLKPQ